MEDFDDPSVTVKRDTGEIYIGVCADALLNPSLYCFYDFGRKELMVEGAIRYFVDFSESLSSDFGIDLGAKFGYVHSKIPYGLDKSLVETFRKDYFFYGVNADVVYTVTKGANVKFGVAYEGNSASEFKKGRADSWVNAGGKKANMWFNASLSCSF
jgi:hypothetical protein